MLYSFVSICIISFLFISYAYIVFCDFLYLYFVCILNSVYEFELDTLNENNHCDAVHVDELGHFQ